MSTAQEIYMRILRAAIVLFVVVVSSAAQTADALLSDTRLTVHTLVREDVFAGFLGNDMARMAKGEANIESLMKSRPDQKANLLAWRSGAALKRAVVAHEAGQAAGVCEAVRDRARRICRGREARDRRSERRRRRHHRWNARDPCRQPPRRTPCRCVGAGLRQLLAAVETAGRRHREYACALQGRSDLPD